jgi:hypothetical protein
VNLIVLDIGLGVRVHVFFRQKGLSELNAIEENNERRWKQSDMGSSSPCDKRQKDRSVKKTGKAIGE